MSLYRVGQNVVFSIPSIGFREIRGFIAQVRQDADNGAERDLYLVEVTEEGFMYRGGRYTIGNDNVNSAELMTTPGTTGQVTYFSPTINAFTWGPINEVRINPSEEESEDNEIHDDEGGWDDEASDEEEAEIDPAPQDPIDNPGLNLNHERIQQLIERSARDTQGRTSIPSNDDTPRPAKRATPIPVPQPPVSTTPVPKDIVYNEMETPTEDEIVIYRSRFGFAPAGILNVDGIRRPVFHSSDLGSVGVLTGSDYNPTAANDRFITFTISGTPIYPAYDTTHRIVVFKSSGGGIYISEYTDPRVINTDYYRDNCRVRWVHRDKLWRWYERNGLAVPSPYPKKKLRRKYKEMPKIKEGKPYATKEYIA